MTAMLAIGLASFGAAALAWTVLTVLLVMRGPGTGPGRWLVAACVAQLAWAMVLGGSLAGNAVAAAVLVPVAEALRNVLWIAFLLSLARSAGRGAAADHPAGRAMSLATVLAATLSSAMVAVDAFAFGPAASFGLRVVIAVLALVCLEQVYRNTPGAQRWSLKFLALAVAGLFAFDVFVFSDALLFQKLEPTLWVARGFVNALVVPLMAVAAARNRDWKLDIAVSREVVFHSATLLAAGVYLVALAAVGWALQWIGASWSGIAQAVIAFGALLGGAVLLLSGALRARLRVLLAKHFFSHRFDYRAEWLRLTQRLGGPLGVSAARATQSDEPGQQALEGLATIVESQGGAVWLRDDAGQFAPVARRSCEVPAEPVPGDDSLPRFLRDTQWIVSVPEWREHPERYAGLTLPPWLTHGTVADAWLIVPVSHQEELLGFVLLRRSIADRPLDWETRDILKTAARQIASYLAVRRAVEALVQARQFESFNKMSAFVVHDLKNLVAQLNLLVRNAARHKDNPEFQADMIATVENVVDRMQGLLLQLRVGVRPIEAPGPVALAAVLAAAVTARRGQGPEPSLELPEAAGQDVVVSAHRDRLERVIGHLVQNATEATPANGKIVVSMRIEQDHVTIAVSDTGKGMSAAFVRERLFRPFASTKAHGMGIGTFESREYVREIGGELTVDTREGAGTTFRIRLPRLGQTPAAGRAADLASLAS